MTPVCAKGHPQTPENVSTGKRARCKPCKRGYLRTYRGPLKGTNPLVERSQAVTAARIEDIEDLLGFGATFQEVLSRSGYTQASDMYRALRNAGKHEVYERLRSIR